MNQNDYEKGAGNKILDQMENIVDIRLELYTIVKFIDLNNEL